MKFENDDDVSQSRQSFNGKMLALFVNLISLFLFSLPFFFSPHSKTFFFFVWIMKDYLKLYLNFQLVSRCIVIDETCWGNCYFLFFFCNCGHMMIIIASDMNFLLQSSINFLWWILELKLVTFYCLNFLWDLIGF